MAENNVYARESGYSNAIKNSAIIGIAPEFVYTDGLAVEEVTVKFELDNSIEDKVITKSQTKRIVLNLDRWTGNINDLTTQFENYAIDDLVEILIVRNGDVFRFYPIS